MSERFNYGVYGVGRIGRMHIAMIMEQGHNIAAVGDDIPAAIAAIEAPGLESVPTFTDAEEMAQADIDGVVVASHTRDHRRHTLPFVNAGIPVYLEKPLTDELDEAFDFVATIGRNRKLLQIGLQRRFDPALALAHQMLADGLIGEVREIRSVLRDQRPPPPTFRSPGLIIDMGIHLADEANFLLGELPVEIRARAYDTKGYEGPAGEGGDTAFVTFTTASGVLGRLDMSRTHSSGYNNETYVIGTDGTLHVGRFAGYPGPIHVELWRSDGTLHPASKTFDMFRPTGDYPEFLPRFDAAYRAAHDAFRQAIEEGSDFAVTQNEALDAQVFVESAHRSTVQDGAAFTVERADDLVAYRAACRNNGLIGS